MTSVIIFQRRLTSYRVPLFEVLRSRLAEFGVELQFVYGPPGPGEEARRDRGSLSWGVEVPARYFQSGKNRLVWHSLPWQLMLSADLVILAQENALLANYPVLLARRMRNRPVAFWGHGANFKGVAGSLRERFKGWLSHQVDWWFAYTSLSAERVVNLGFPPQQITNLNNAVQTGELVGWRNAITAEEKLALLDSLGLSGSNVAIFLGSLAEEKRFDFLFAAAEGIRGAVNDFELVLIGDGPLREMVKAEVARRPWVRWVGAQHGRAKILHMSMGKVILNPGMVGLGILDSFVMGQPMITTDCGLHSPEIAYLESGRNGLMTENQVGSYALAVSELLQNDELRHQMATACFEDANKYTLDNMAEAFAQGILEALAKHKTV